MKTKFIAEIASNHNGNMDRCIKLIQDARDAGCFAVKFQLFELEKLFAPEALIVKPELKERKKWELPRNFINMLSYHAKICGLRFGITPFDLESADYIFPYIDFYKVASYNILDVKLLKNIALKGRPIILSTGAATLQEINTAVNLIKSFDKKADLTVLHCVSAYPTPVESCNLQNIDRIRGMGVKTGWSDHSHSEAVMYRAVHKYNSDVVEFHLDYEDGSGVDGGEHCWKPSEIKRVITNCKDGFAADGFLPKIDIVESVEEHERDWRADPSDGLRPLLHERQKILYG